MRELTNHRCGNGLDEHIRIEAADSPINGAHHHYRIYRRGLDNLWGGEIELRFQKGPLMETLPNGTTRRLAPNGITHETLLAILIDRLEGFQSGPFACKENKEAITALNKAQKALHKRTADRVARGVEGVHKP